MYIRYSIKYFSTIYIVLAFFSGANTFRIDPANDLKGIYCTFSSESWFMYEFIDNNTFEFRTEGHFGKTRTIGCYFVEKDTIRFAPYSKELQPDSFYFKIFGPLVKVNDSCLRSSINENYCRITPDGWCYPEIDASKE